MRRNQAVIQRILLPVGTLMLILLLAACEAAAPGPGGSGGAGPTRPAATPAPTQGIGTANGCPTNAAAPSSLTRPDVIIRDSDANKTITAHVGNTIAVMLPFGQKWTGPTISQGTLELQPPAGFASKDDHACIWRFVARGTGTTQLVFHGQALCKPGQMCPQYIITMIFTVDVR
ncbi:MAG: hypothetical protein IMW89_00130 [Ktedonobacteraceae bacterium]|nr:hypothetical protein [Ktedonobacteraceae bacterium]